MYITALLIGSLVGLITYFVYFFRKRLSYWHDLGIDCDKPHWLLGSFTGLRTERSFADVWISYYQRYKHTKAPFVGIYWFSHPAVMILQPELMKTILVKEFPKFMDRGFYNNPEADPLTGQLFFLDGQKWKTLRQKLTPTFTSGKIKVMFSTVLKVAEQLMSTMQEKINEGDQGAEGVVEVRDLLARFGTDVIGSCAFGIECNSLTDAQTKFHIMGRRLLTEQRHGEIGNALMFNFPKLMKKFRLKTIPEDISEFFMSLVQDTVKYRDENKEQKRNDFLDMLLELRDNKVIKNEAGDELKTLTIEEIAAQVVLFFTAGFETSSTTLGFALYELAQHQALQEQARQEVLAVLEKHDQQLSYENVREMIYLCQIIEETLRIYTVLPVLNRHCLEDYEVPGYPKYIIKKGMNVLIPSIAIHRDAEYYPEPEKFNPDNFSAEKVRERDPILYQAFGEGPRNCIGMRFGQMQTRVALALLLKNFRFSICEKTQVPPALDKRSFFVGAESGIYLKVEKL